MMNLMRIALLWVAFVCAGAATVQAEDTLRLPGGTPVVLPGTDAELTLTKVADSRCPSDVECVWEGMVRADVRVAQGAGAPVTMFLCNACSDADRSITVAGRELALVRLEPTMALLAKLSRNVTLTDYTLVLEISDK
jgi:hypothetical protein